MGTLIFPTMHTAIRRRCPSEDGEVGADQATSSFHLTATDPRRRRYVVSLNVKTPTEII